MQVQPLGIEGAWLITPDIHRDDRGLFLEWFREEPFVEQVGSGLHLAQANCSVSMRGVVRGIHFADVPPGQAKYITCVSGAIQDVVVDVRLGSPTYGQWESVQLDDRNRRAVYLSEGLGHGFAALEDQSTTVYLCSEGYNPAREHGVNPLDPDIGIEWAVTGPELSPKDSVAPTLAQCASGGLLPRWEASMSLRGNRG